MPNHKVFGGIVVEGLVRGQVPLSAVRTLPDKERAVLDLLLQFRMLADVDSVPDIDIARFAAVPARRGHLVGCGHIQRRLFLVDPFPGSVHQRPPGQKQNQIHPVGKTGLEPRLFRVLVEVGNIRVVVGARSEIQFRLESETIRHDIQADRQDSPEENPGQDSAYYFFVHMQRSRRKQGVTQLRVGIGKSTPDSSNQTAKKVSTMLNVWPIT